MNNKLNKGLIWFRNSNLTMRLLLVKGRKDLQVQGKTFPLSIRLQTAERSI